MSSRLNNNLEGYDNSLLERRLNDNRIFKEYSNKITQYEFNRVMFTPPIEHYILRDLEYYFYNSIKEYSYHEDINKYELKNSSVSESIILIDKENKTALARLSDANSSKSYQIVDFNTSSIIYDLANRTRRASDIDLPIIFSKIEPDIFPAIATDSEYYMDDNVYSMVIKSDDSYESINNLLQYDFKRENSVIISSRRDRIIKINGRPTKRLINISCKEYYYRDLRLSLPNNNEFINK